jgi:hypothetical protein
MPRGPKGEKRPADVNGNALHFKRIATTRFGALPIAKMVDASLPALPARSPQKQAAEISS